ncbi:MAG: hypothetical protein U5K37_11000 [Natrialbaceae archaeon]|nr:hypothetical protein [Natrialbaceae archaeon]
MHCNDFEDRSVALETLTMDDRISTGCLRQGETIHSYNRPEQVVGDTVTTTVNEPGRWEFAVDADTIAFEVSAVADQDHWQLASYLTPDGSCRGTTPIVPSRLSRSRQMMAPGSVARQAGSSGSSGVRRSRAVYPPVRTRR